MDMSKQLRQVPNKPSQQKAMDRDPLACQPDATAMAPSPNRARPVLEAKAILDIFN
jgi:hypothetical protein